MHNTPRISIVTPSFNQGRYIADTIESVASQGYPDLEHIVMDGGSTDETLEVLARYPHLRVISEKDGGQADAINKGFRLATGQIWGFVNSDDTLLPGALTRVAQEIDPKRGRHIVMGRCRFVDEDGRFVGIEHPSYFESHRRVLAIWKGHGIPQPAVFWTPEVWHVCGGLLEQNFHLDYDLFCRFSREYRFHTVNQVFATYRLHSESKTSQYGESERLEDTIRIGRQYWGGPRSFLYWQLLLSLAWYRFDRVGRSNRLMYRAMELRRHQLPVALAMGAASTALAPEVPFYTVAYPRLRSRSGSRLSRISNLFLRRNHIAPQTAVYFDHTDVWPDGWAGPRIVQTVETISPARELRIVGDIPAAYLKRSPVISVSVDGHPVGEGRVKRHGSFELVLPLDTPVEAGRHQIEVQSSEWYVGHNYVALRDFRPLSWRVKQVALSA